MTRAPLLITPLNTPHYTPRDPSTRRHDKPPPQWLSVDHFRRSVRKSDASDTASAASGHHSNSSTTSFQRLAKTFSWKPRSDSSSNASSNTNSSSDDDTPAPCMTDDRPEKGVPSWLKKKNKPAKKPLFAGLSLPTLYGGGAKASKSAVDPREKPFTEVNLRHQEMLSGFTFTFGNRCDSRRSSIHGGISPGTSRMPSFDGGSRSMPSAADDDERDPFDNFDEHFLSPAAAQRRPALFA